MFLFGILYITFVENIKKWRAFISIFLSVKNVVFTAIFFSSTSQEDKTAYVHAVCEELKERKNYLEGQEIRTIYFGGGTPSQLSASDFEAIFEAIRKFYFNPNPEIHEITLEANPDDITPEYLNSIRKIPFNRISLGVQSFNEEELVFLNRRHDAASAKNAIKLCRDYGFSNISIDLIYGIPGQTEQIWRKTLEEAIHTKAPHISAYHLIYEENTPLCQLLDKKKVKQVEEEQSIRLFEMMIDTLSEAGYKQYEISNFAMDGFHSRHNSSYWDGSHYLGVGASAHSYNGSSRCWNASVNGPDYLKKERETEFIDAKMAYNEFILTRLRTIRGISLQEMKKLFGENACLSFQKQAQKFIDAQLLEFHENHIRLTRKGLFVSDGVMSDFMH